MQTNDIYTEYTFENLVVGSSNQFAYAAAKAVSLNPGTMYSPLIIYGNVGLGKTHLLQAIGNNALHDGKSISYNTFELFFNELRKHITANSMDYFREKYRNIDFLLLDDIQFIANKEVLQEEFFNTINDLKRFQKQVVLTSDRHPKELLIEDRIKNRLEGGLIAEVQAPDINTKKEIIRKKSARNRMLLNEEMISYISSHVLDNVRIIEGILLKIHAYSVLMDESVTLELVKHVVEETKTETQEKITLEKIISKTATYCNVKPSEIRSNVRNHPIVKARRIAIFLARELTTSSMSLLAKEFKMKDHTSISHAVTATRKALLTDKEFSAFLEVLKNQIQS